MAKQTKEKPLLIKLYTSLRFWVAVLLFFYVVFSLIGFKFSKDLVFNLWGAALGLAFMPGSAIRLYNLSWFDDSFFFYYMLVWLPELAGVTWLKLKGGTAQKRTVFIVGTIIVLSLVTQFVVCSVNGSILISPPGY